MEHDLVLTSSRIRVLHAGLQKSITLHEQDTGAYAVAIVAYLRLGYAASNDGVIYLTEKARNKHKEIVSLLDRPIIRFDEKQLLNDMNNGPNNQPYWTLPFWINNLKFEIYIEKGKLYANCNTVERYFINKYKKKIYNTMLQGALGNDAKAQLRKELLATGKVCKEIRQLLGA